MTKKMILWNINFQYWRTIVLLVNKPIYFLNLLGMGVGLATSAAFVALNHYFAKKRGQAVGLSMAGTALGMLFMPQLVRILLEVYSFQGAMLLLSGLAIHASGTLFID
jgi:MFS family permease